MAKAKSKATKKSSVKSFFDPSMSEEQIIARAGVLYAAMLAKDLNREFDEDTHYLVTKGFIGGFELGSLVPPVVERAKKELKK